MLTSFPSPLELKGTVQGTVLYLFLYFGVFIPFQSFSKIYLFRKKIKEAKKNDSKEKVSFRATKYYNSRDNLALTGDRMVGNFIEQAIIFLPLLWIHALFVDPSQSLLLSCIYVLSRAIYPIMYMLGSNKKFLLILVSTVPGYAINTYLIFSVLFRVALT